MPFVLWVRAVMRYLEGYMQAEGSLPVEIDLLDRFYAGATPHQVALELLIASDEYSGS